MGAEKDFAKRSWNKDQFGAFQDLAKETMAKECAKGTPLSVLSEQLGLGVPTLKHWHKRKEMRERIAILRATSDKFVGVSLGWILDQLKETGLEARKMGQFKAATETFKTMFEIVTKHPELVNEMPIAGPDIPDGEKLNPGEMLLQLRSDNDEQLQFDVEAEAECVEVPGQTVD